ncbi:hypothetical protein CS006_00470 [Bifidobacterium primatium]|uniref:Uncharacterized protein n=1 Tax=Bifidobacterium primatium TaxID=2045438 RepID=A0A2M9HA62_9BIFI|nr:hypothetical protein [Bifidobacterium primatium]PJM73706.1 hypothetical protein CS006_00470 [Bifidobacterium primatium]
MSDTKAAYSDAAKHYVEDIVPASAKEQERYRAAKEREAKYNDDWLKHPVNINDIVDEFTPGATGRKKGYKYKFSGKDWIVLADMIAGYLRIIDKRLGKFVMLNGNPSDDQSLTHFKILKRRDMQS